jgi:hypothetical protein
MDKLVFRGFNHRLEAELSCYYKAKGLRKHCIPISFYCWIERREIKIDRIGLYHDSINEALACVDLQHVKILYVLYFFGKRDIAHLILQFFSKCCCLEEVYFWHLCPDSHIITNLLATFCPRLRIFYHNDMVEFERKNTDYFMNKCLHVTDCTFLQGHNVLDSDVAHLTSSLSNLNVLRISNCSKVTNSGLNEALKSCVKLTSIHLSDCDQITEDFFAWLEPFHCKQIRYLSLCFSDQFGDIAMSFIADRLKNLTILNVAHCHNITDEGMLFLFRNCTMITDLDISSTRNLTHISAEHIVKFLKHINKVDMERTTDNTLIKASKMYAILLVAFDFKYIKWIDQYRRIEWRERHTKHDPQIDDVGPNYSGLDMLVPILQNKTLCESLVALSSFTVYLLQQTHYLCDVLSQCDDTLLVLHLMGMVTATTGMVVVQVELDVLQCIATNCSKLNVLRISYCRVMSHMGLTAICAKNPRLLHVSMHHCYLNDDDVFAISFGCKHIQYLDISFNKDVSDNSMFCVADCCPSLTSINLIETQVSTSAIAELLKGCKLLRYVRHSTGSVAY